ncbi:MAG: stage V sporulation protein S, partial [Anaerolineae bacterium]
IDIICVPLFVEVTIEGQERTAVRLHVERRGSEAPRPAPEAEEESGPGPTLEAESGPSGPTY